ncbi:unnamed protein product [Musa acuminata subsp. malaccensis]|uniref:(wild Malaysian banana) hypothetical protein n=1 Tax=Musa acuminata subsp. malaccensis TaxID=214687 RepID=A0A8D7B2K5_MUSAM|nr:unnamed protein product [Musa acuminata subsp. malaccensis]
MGEDDEKQSEKRYISSEELRLHNTPSDLWISIQGKVYDATHWVKDHPGGELPLFNLAGQDVTDAFVAYHPGTAWSLLDRLPPGRLPLRLPSLRRVQGLPTPDHRYLQEGPLRQEGSHNLHRPLPYVPHVRRRRVRRRLLSQRVGPSRLRGRAGVPVDAVGVPWTRLRPLPYLERPSGESHHASGHRELPRRNKHRMVEAEPQRSPHRVQQPRVRPRRAAHPRPRRLLRVIPRPHVLLLRAEDELRRGGEVAGELPALDVLPGDVRGEVESLRAVGAVAAVEQEGAGEEHGVGGVGGVLGLVPAARLLPAELGREGDVRGGQLRGDRDPARAVLLEPLLLQRLRRAAAGERLVREADDGDAGHHLRALDGLVPRGAAVPGGAPPVPAAAAVPATADRAPGAGALQEARPSVR